MNARHKLFATEYLKNGKVGVQAVFAAGYQQGYNSACVQASRLLRNAKVKSMIDAITDKANTEAELTTERVSKEIAKIAFAPNIQIDSSAKMKGLDLATKVLGMQTTKTEVTDTSERDGAKSALLLSIQSLADDEQIPLESAELQLQVRFADKLRKTYKTDFDPQVNPALWPSGCLLSKSEDIGQIEGEQ